MVSEKVVKILNRLRDEETTASLQYMNHYAVLKNLNLHFIAEFLEKIAIEEMKHAEDLTDRLLDLETNPGGYKAKPAPHWGLAPLENLKKDIALEIEAIKEYNDAIDLCVKEKDHITRQLLDRILADEEKHKLRLQDFHNALEKVGDMKGAMIGLMQALKGDK